MGDVRVQRGVGGLLAVVLLLVGVLAVRAAGFSGVDVELNDGSAWLIDVPDATAARVNGAVREAESKLRVAERGDEYRVLQAPGVLVVHNRSAGTLTPIDVANHDLGGAFTLPEGVGVEVGAGAAMFHRATTGEVWRTEVAGLSVGSVNEDEPDYVVGEAGLAAMGTDGRVHLVTEDGRLAVLGGEDGLVERRLDMRAGALSAAGSNTVVLDVESGEVASFGAIEGRWTLPGAAESADVELRLQQASTSDRTVAVASEDGRVWSVDLRSDDEPEQFSGNGGQLLAPVVVGRCVFSVSQETMRFIRHCGPATLRTDRVDGIPAGSRVRIFAANERVWIDHLDGERAVYLPEDGDPESIESWGNALFLEDEESGDADDASGENLVRGDSGDESSLLGEGSVQEDEGGFVGGDNQSPTARADELNARPGRSRTIRVLDNDSDPNGDLLIVTDVESVSPEQGIVVVSPDRRTVQFTPTAGTTGAVTFGYGISDGRGGTDRSTVRVTLVGNDVNSAPTPDDDRAVVRAGLEVSIPVLVNDTDPEGDPLELVGVDEGAGTVNVDTRQGIVTIIPNADARGEQVYTYTVRDDLLLEGSAQIILDVIPADAPNQPPVAEPDLYVVAQGAELTLRVLDNDTDVDPDEVLVVSETQTVVGDVEVTLNPETGEAKFPTDVPGTYVLTYVLEDDDDRALLPGLIRVEVLEDRGNLPPIAVADAPPDLAPVEAGTARSFNVLANDRDPNDDPLVVVSVAPIDEQFPLLRLVERADGNFLVQPSGDLVGSEVTFRYTISDGFETASTTVTVRVIAPPATDEPPVAEDDTGESVRAGQSVLLDVLANDRDPEGLPLSIGSFESPDVEGVTVVQEDEQLRIVVAETVSGSVEFRYAAEDFGGQTDSAVVRVQVLPPEIPNQAPQASDVDASTISPDPVIIPVLDSASDPDGDPLSIADVTSPQNGVVEIVRDGGAAPVIRYTPDDQFVGTDEFTYIVADPENARAGASVRVIVQEPPEVNSPPNAIDDVGQEVRVGRTISIPVLANDSDIDGDELSLAKVGTASLGEARAEGNLVVFTAPDAIGDDPVEVSIPYWISDGNEIIVGREASYTAVVQISVIPPEPKPPEPEGDQYGPYKEGETHTLSVLDNDVDPDGTQAELRIQSVAGSDAVSVAADGRSVALITPDAPFSFTYVVEDADGETATAAVSVNVIPNRPPETGVDTAEIRQQEFGDLRVLDNDEDADGDPLTLLSIGDFRGGIATIENLAEGIVRFTPDDGVTQGGFSYRVSDGPGGHEVTGAAQITVLPPANTEPTARPGTLSVPAGETQTYDLVQLADDAETPNGLSITEVSGATDAVQVALNANGSISITTAIDARGATATIGWTVADGGPGDPLRASSTLEVSVVETRRPRPQAVNDGPFETNQGQSLPMNDLIANDQPTDGGLRIVVASATGNGGSVAISGDERGVVYTPDPDFSGTFGFTYTIEDETGQADRRSTSGTISVNVIGRPDQVATLSGQPSSERVELTWPTPNGNGGGIDGYEIELDGTIVLTTGNTNAAALDASHGLRNNQQFTARVRAFNQAGPADSWSPAFTFTPDSVPDQPQAPSLDPTDGVIDVTWTLPNANGSEIIDFDVRVLPAGTQQLTLANGGTITNLQNGTEYSVQIRFQTRATENGGWSEFSPFSSAIPFGRPFPVTNLQCVGVTDGSVELSWQSGGDNGAAISSYTVFRAGDDEEKTALGSSLTWNIGNGVTETFSVGANNQAGPSDVTSVTCTTPDRPEVPGNVAATTSSPGEATVTWSQPNDNGAVIQSYRITASNGASLTAAGTSVTFNGLENGTGYSFRVEALNAVGWSDPSPDSNVVIPVTAPQVPTGLSATDGRDASTTLSWNNLSGAAQTGGAEIQTYEIVSNVGTNYSSASSPHPVTGLVNGEQYSFRIRACNARGLCSAYSGWSNTITPVSPITAPSPVSAPATTRNYGTVTFSWNNTADNGGAAITCWKVDVEGTGGDTDCHNARSITISMPNGSTSARARVQACNSAGLCSSWSSWSSQTTSKIRVRARGLATINLINAAGNAVVQTLNNAGGTWYDITCKTPETGIDSFNNYYYRHNGSTYLIGSDWEAPTFPLAGIPNC